MLTLVLGYLLLFAVFSELFGRALTHSPRTWTIPLGVSAALVISTIVLPHLPVLSLPIQDTWFRHPMFYALAGVIGLMASSLFPWGRSDDSNDEHIRYSALQLARDARTLRQEVKRLSLLCQEITESLLSPLDEGPELQKAKRVLPFILKKEFKALSAPLGELTNRLKDLEKQLPQQSHNGHQHD